MAEVLLTKEGYEKIKAEYEELVTVKRKEVSERLKEAISYGDISENAEYDAAKNEQADVEARIAQLENMMKDAKVIDESELSNDFVGVGSKVVIKDLETNEKKTYIIGGSTEADPFAEIPKISNESELGKHLIGKTKGDKFEINVPMGTFKYQVVSISR